MQGRTYKKACHFFQRSVMPSSHAFRGRTRLPKPRIHRPSAAISKWKASSSSLMVFWYSLLVMNRIYPRIETLAMHGWDAHRPEGGSGESEG